MLDFVLSCKLVRSTNAFYAVSVRRCRILPSASFRFHLTMDTFAVWLMVPTTKPIADFHRLVTAHAGRTQNTPAKFDLAGVFCLSIYGLYIDINIMTKIRMGELFGSPVFRRFTDCLVLPGGLNGTLGNHYADLAGFGLYGCGLRAPDSRNIHNRYPHNRRLSQKSPVSLYHNLSNASRSPYSNACGRGGQPGTQMSTGTILFTGPSSA